MAAANTVVAKIVKDSDTLVDLLCLEDAGDGTTIITAAVTVTITDIADVALTGETFPVTMNHSAKGNYRGSVADTLVVSVGQVVKVKVTADDGAGRRRVFTKTVTVEE